jgi:hypothetical protein
MVCSCKARPTTACTRLPTARFIRGYAPATTPLIGVGLAGPAAGEAEALGAVLNPPLDQISVL